jgi:quercetin dioxygenase-like cupin family protein
MRAQSPSRSLSKASHRKLSQPRPRRPAGKVYAYDMLEAAWTDTGLAGLRQKVVRMDRERGLFLGLLAFEPLTRTGLHQHQATAISYFLDGSLCDYAGFASAGMAGINLRGATHDAIAYNRCLLAARLEGPVTYPSKGGHATVHAGSRPAEIVNGAPEVMPDINILVEALPALATTLPGVSRRLVFGYEGTGTDRRLVQLSLLPGTRLPAHVASAPLEFFLLGGDLRVNGTAAAGGSFVVIEPGAEIDIASAYGARLLAWAEGPSAWADASGRPDCYGF